MRKDEHSFVDITEHLDYTWPALETLALELLTTEETLLGLLSRHSSSLKHLSLNDSAFQSGKGSWQSFISKLPNTLPQLQSIYLECVAEEDPTFDPGDEDPDQYERRELFDDKVLSLHATAGQTLQSQLGAVDVDADDS